MGGDPDREPPFFFQKPADAIVTCTPGASAGNGIPYPSSTESLHYEGELIVAIDKAGERIEVDDALDHVFGYSVGCDFTRRDLQSEAKKTSRPWDAAKAFDNSCPIAPLISKDD